MTTSHIPRHPNASTALHTQLAAALHARLTTTPALTASLAHRIFHDTALPPARMPALIYQLALDKPTRFTTRQPDWQLTLECHLWSDLNHGHALTTDLLDTLTAALVAKPLQLTAVLPSRLHLHRLDKPTTHQQQTRRTTAIYHANLHTRA